MKDNYSIIILTVIAVLLLWIGLNINSIAFDLVQEFRPVRTNNNEYDVASVKHLTIMDDWKGE